ncbi:Uncharacterized protein HA466_0201350 [Hirschfeldia incana]|nr:Uncharacterized protein HA466_0201350 [Hirschfeldia incana]
MVFSGEGGEVYMSTMAREIPKTRHNFTLPADLKWGVQRSLRCMNVHSHGGADDRSRRSEERIEEKIKESIFREQVEDKMGREREVSPPGVAAEVKPWNLRKRRAACKAPITESGNCDANQNKFVSTLTKKEVEDDYMMMMGHRPPRRPKKRLRTLQKQIDLLHPAFYFTEVTEDLYEVPDAAETRKR